MIRFYGDNLLKRPKRLWKLNLALSTSQRITQSFPNTVQHCWHVCLGHGELEAGADVSDHDEGSGGAQEVEGGMVDVQKLEGVHHHRGRDQGQHREVELTPSGSEQYQVRSHHSIPGSSLKSTENILFLNWTILSSLFWCRLPGRRWGDRTSPRCRWCTWAGSCRVCNIKYRAVKQQNFAKVFTLLFEEGLL